MTQQYEVVIKATGEVRDAEGNLLDTVVTEETRLVSEDDIKNMMGGEQR